MNISGEMAQQITKGFNIPPKPEVLQQVQAIASGDSPSVADVAECVAMDVGLSAAILKTVNSASFGMSRTIADVHQAVSLLGMNTVINLVAGYEIRRAMSAKASISLERFWDGATDVAQTMVFAGRAVGASVPAEDLYAVGLFHDCGLAAMAMKFEDYKQTLLEANENHDLTIVELEEERYNTNHAVVGYFIASSWDLPRHICEVILRHHDEDALDENNSDEFVALYAVLKMSENIVERTRRFQSDPEWLWVKKDVFDALGISSLEYSDIEEDVGDQVLV